jgi:hypothetical protein
LNAPGVDDAVIFPAGTALHAGLARRRTAAVA